MAALTEGGQYAALDQYTPQQSPLVDERDPFAIARDMLRQRGIQAESEIERIKNDKWGNIFNAIGAFGAGLNGRDASRFSYQNRIQPYQDVLTQAQNGMSDLALQQWQMQQRMAAQKPLTAETVGSPLMLSNGNFGITKHNPDGSTYIQDLGVKYDPKVVQMGGQFWSTTGGSPTGLLTPEEIAENRRREALARQASEQAGERGQSNEQQRQEYIKQGTAARGLLKQTDRLLELNNLIATGKTAAARKAMGDLFNVTDPNLGEFNSLAGNLVLGSIRQLGANPTEGERAYLSEIMPSIAQGGQVNAAILSNLRAIQQAQLERARWLVQNPDRTVEEYLLLNDDFEPVVPDLQRDPVEAEADRQNTAASGFKIISVE